MAIAYERSSAFAKPKFLCSRFHFALLPSFLMIVISYVSNALLVGVDQGKSGEYSCLGESI